MVKSISSRAKKKFQVPLTKASSFNFYQRICGFSIKESRLYTFYLKIVCIKDKEIILFKTAHTPLKPIYYYLVY